MILADHVADHAGRLLGRPVVRQPQLVHGVQDPPVDRLEAVAGVGQGPADDDAHRVVDVRRPHLVFDVDRDGRIAGGRRGGSLGVLGHGFIR